MVIDQTLRMYTNPIELNADMLNAHLVKVRDDKRKLIDALALKGLSEDQIKKALMSNQIFAKLLTRLGIEPPMKTSLRTGKKPMRLQRQIKEFTDLANTLTPTYKVLLLLG